jgi:hypothetical protein
MFSYHVNVIYISIKNYHLQDPTLNDANTVTTLQVWSLHRHPIDIVDDRKLKTKM